MAALPDAARGVERAAQTETFDRLSRFGWATKGVVYAIMGGLAVLVAVGEGGETTDAQGALGHIAELPLSPVLLGITAAGLLSYGLWRWVEALLDPEDRGTGAKGVAARTGYAASGSFYFFLAGYVTWRLLEGSSPEEGGDQAEGLLRPILDAPAGPWLVGAVAVVALATAGYQVYQAVKAPFLERWRTGEMSDGLQQAASAVARFGLAARGVVFGMVSVLIARAALNDDASESGGLGEALAELSAEPLILAVVAAGFVAYGAFCFVNAAFRRTT